MLYVRLEPKTKPTPNRIRISGHSKGRFFYTASGGWELHRLRVCFASSFRSVSHQWPFGLTTPFRKRRRQQLYLKVIFWVI